MAAKGWLHVRLNADIIYHNLKDALDVTIYGMCETELALYRPEFYLDKNSRFLENHVLLDKLPDKAAGIQTTAYQYP